MDLYNLCVPWVARVHLITHLMYSRREHIERHLIYCKTPPLLCGTLSVSGDDGNVLLYDYE